MTREYTINLHKRVHNRSFKKRAPWAVKVCTLLYYIPTITITHLYPKLKFLSNIVRDWFRSKAHGDNRRSSRSQIEPRNLESWRQGCPSPNETQVGEWVHSPISIHIPRSLFPRSSILHSDHPSFTGKRNDDEGAKEKLYTYCSYIPVETFKGLQTTVVDAE